MFESRRVRALITSNLPNHISWIVNGLLLSVFIKLRLLNNSGWESQSLEDCSKRKMTCTGEIRTTKFSDWNVTIWGPVGHGWTRNIQQFQLVLWFAKEDRQSSCLYVNIKVHCLGILTLASDQECNEVVSVCWHLFVIDLGNLKITNDTADYTHWQTMELYMDTELWDVQGDLYWWIESRL